MRRRILFSVLAVLTMLTWVGCVPPSRAERERFRGYVSDDMIERPHLHKGKWAAASVIYGIGRAAAGQRGYIE